MSFTSCIAWLPPGQYTLNTSTTINNKDEIIIENNANIDNKSSEITIDSLMKGYDDSDVDETDLNDLMYYEPNQQDPNLQIDSIDDIESDNEMNLQESDALFYTIETDEDSENQCNSELVVHVYNQSNQTLFDYCDIILGPNPCNSMFLKDGLACVSYFENDNIDILKIDDWTLTSESKVAPFYIFNKDSNHEGNEYGYASLSYNNSILLAGNCSGKIHYYNIDNSWGGGELYNFNSNDIRINELQCHPDQMGVFLSGTSTGILSYHDNRSKHNKVQNYTYGYKDEINSIHWLHNNTNYFLVGNNSGNLMLYELRKPNCPLFDFKNAHKDAISSISVSQYLPGLCVTSSLDSILKLWRITPENSEKIKYIEKKKIKCGPLFSCQFFPGHSYKYHVATCGQSNFGVWDLETDSNEIPSLYPPQNMN